MVNMRCFVAIDLTESVKNGIKSIQNSIMEEALKMVAYENLHITLKFLGELDECSVNRAITKLKAIRMHAFDVKIASIGVFPRPDHIKVVWLGIEPANEVEKLAAMVDKEIATNEKFVPHITIARVKRRPEKLAENMQKIGKAVASSMHVSSFKLKKSVLTPNGPVYEDLAVFPLS